MVVPAHRFCKLSMLGLLVVTLLTSSGSAVAYVGPNTTHRSGPSPAENVPLGADTRTSATPEDDDADDGSMFDEIETGFEVATVDCPEGLTAAAIATAGDLAPCTAPMEQAMVSIRSADGMSATGVSLGGSASTLTAGKQPGRYTIDAVGMEGDLSYAIVCTAPDDDASMATINVLHDVAVIEGALTSCTVYDIDDSAVATSEMTFEVSSCPPGSTLKTIKRAEDMDACTGEAGFVDITITLADGTFAGTRRAGHSASSVTFGPLPAGEALLTVDAGPGNIIMSCAGSEGVVGGGTLRLTIPEGGNTCRIATVDPID